MTLWVAGAVTVVAGAILFCAALLLRQQFEKEVNEQLDEAVDLTAKLIDQRMLRIEYATRTLAAVSSDYIGEPDEDIDTILCRMVTELGCIDLASLVLDKKDGGERSIYYAFKDGPVGMIGENETIPNYNRIILDKDPNWIASYKEGKPFWSGLYTPRNNVDTCYMCFSYPIYDETGKRCGILCSQILYKWIKDIITRYKVRKDISVAVVAVDGSYIVRPEIDVTEVNKDNYIQKDLTLKYTGWKLIFTADKQTMKKQMNSMLMQIALGMLLLIVTVIVTIILTVRYVARPFVLKQQHMAEAKAAMQRELDIAANTQRELVPNIFPPFPERKDIDLHACLHPALEVGGDLYDYFISDDTLYFCIGDVSGKGVPASLFMAATHYLFRSVADKIPMVEAVRHINLALCTDNSQCTFVTFWFGCLNLKTGVLEYVNAGHNSPIIIHDGKAEFMPKSENMPLGVWDDEYESYTINIDHGDTILLYTDGVTEAMNTEGEILGDDATLEILNKTTETSAEGIVNHVFKCVRRHATGAKQSDDITMLCVRLTI